MSLDVDDISNYYRSEALRERVKSALSTIEKSFDELDIEDFAVIDEFHIRGQSATEELIVISGFPPESKILDLGCGIGGSARRLSVKGGCSVTGIDLSGEYIACAEYLTKLVRLESSVSFEHGSCLDLPFDESSFDGAWTIQMMMNIEQKERLLEEVKRALKPGAKFVLYEIMLGNIQDPYFPVPWAQSAKQNSLCSQSELNTLLRKLGFNIESWEDKTEVAKKAFEGMSRPSSDSKLPPLGVHLLVGDDILTKAYNVKRNLDEGRISLLQAVAINT